MSDERYANPLTRQHGLDTLRGVAKKIGRIAQLEERCPYKAEVTGSIPVPPTISEAGTQPEDRAVDTITQVRNLTDNHRYSLVVPIFLYR